MISYISNAMVPLVILYIVLYAFFKKEPVFDNFLEGVKEGMGYVLALFPTIFALTIAVGMLRNSEVLTSFSNLIEPVTNILKVPKEIVPLLFARPISHAAALGFLFDIFKAFGPDSYIGKVASILLDCGETLVYTLGIYLASVSITKSRYVIKGALIIYVVGLIAALILAGV